MWILADTILVVKAYALPPRKASPPPHAPRFGPLVDSNSAPPPITLHSTISPLTPCSPLYPDGIMTPLWITKHQNRLPAVFITFFALIADPNTSSLHDNQIKTEIGNIRGVFSSTNYKTKVMAILIGEMDTDSPIDVDERVGGIRKATGLDSRHLFFLSQESSKEATVEFVRSIMSSLQLFCIEYYRDLSKHTRRKRNRSSIPPPTAPPTSGTSQTLPLQGWNARYEFKLGVFAEFRQEMDAACRNYESAYGALFSHELFETISNWSPRFNEARLLADATAIRILRCLLWTAQHTSAVRFWNSHRNRIRDLVNRRGKGTDNYGWEAWEAIWSKFFAQAIARAGIMGNTASDSTDHEKQQIRPLFSPPEKSIPVGERIAPWDLLHHEGYWWNRSWKHTRKRRELAHQMPEEDRTSPGQSPASAIANRSHLYDSYLALEPHLEYPLGSGKGYDYSLEILSTIQSTIRSFLKFGQIRFVEQLRLEEANEYLRAERWHDALATMRSIWPCLSWREAGWWKMVAEATWAFREAAKQTNDAESLLRLAWEAHNSTVPMGSGWKYDIQRCLDGVDLTREKRRVVIKSENCLSPIFASVRFETSEGNVGEPLKAQLVLVSTGHPSSTALRLSEIKIVFEGGLRPIRVLLSDSETSTQAQSTVVSDLYLRESSSSIGASGLTSPTSGLISLIGMADILMQPGQRKVFNMTCIPREAGDVTVASINVLYETDIFSLMYVINQQVTSDARWWSIQGLQPRSRQLGRDDGATTARIMPKPPKVLLEITNLRETYYVNERISLNVLIRNEEAETADVFIEIRLFSPSRHAATIKWQDMTQADSFDLMSNGNGVPSKEFLSLPGHSIGLIPNAGNHSKVLVVDQTLDAMQHALEVTARYHLLCDPETMLTRTIGAELRVSRPFEANYEFLPRLDQTPWPNFFDPSSTANGLSQRFLLICKVTSFVIEPVIIENMSLSLQGIIGNAICEIGEGNTLVVDQGSFEVDKADGTIAPEGLRESSFELLIRKNTLADLSNVALDLALVVEWRRGPGEDLVNCRLNVPRYVIPMSEPRVLLSKGQQTTKDQPGLVHVRYMIENPSMHYLTFNLNMESSDEFAFSGPKATRFSLVPISRRAVDYCILAHQGARWVRISLGVVDAYFNKALRVSPAGEGIRSDGKRGLLVSIE